MALAVATHKVHCAKGFCSFAAAALCDKESLAINSGSNLEQRKAPLVRSTMASTVKSFLVSMTLIERLLVASQ